MFQVFCDIENQIGFTSVFHNAVGHYKEYVKGMKEMIERNDRKKRIKKGKRKKKEEEGKERRKEKTTNKKGKKERIARGKHTFVL
jgi:hypothetical protein